MLAPLLLMLGQDPLMLPDLEDKQRYFPPSFAISAYLTISALFDVSQGYTNQLSEAMPLGKCLTPPQTTTCPDLHAGPHYSF